jgi:hypothetical protein
VSVWFMLPVFPAILFFPSEYSIYYSVKITSLSVQHSTRGQEYFYSSSTMFPPLVFSDEPDDELRFVGEIIFHRQTLQKKRVSSRQQYRILHFAAPSNFSIIAYMLLYFEIFPSF